MDISRINSILANKEKCDVFYDDRPVWIQGVNDNIYMKEIYIITDLDDELEGIWVCPQIPSIL